MSSLIKENMLVAYLPKNTKGVYKVELGIVKRVDYETGKAWVWYHAGGTAACTLLNDLMPVENWYFFQNNTINSLDKQGE